ncbi:hypothetical protein CRG98_028944 [Punica granatum]|nr:hypothetical protein CRG98_028944 [Punica granatum]
MPAVEMEQLREPTEAGAYGSTDNTKDQLESVTEDGELPSLALVASVAKDVKLTPWGPSFGNSKQLRLMSKSISPITKAKSLSFKKQDDELEILLEADSDIDEPAVTEQEVASAVQVRKLAEDAWVEYGAREYRLILTRKLRTDERDVKLEAKIKISMEYPLRPPLFSLSLDSADVQWYNEPRAMEAEVNLHMLKMVPLEHENYVLAHQIHCLAMLFDHYLDGASSSSGKRDSTSIVDVGLCKPVTGSLLGRSYRGRDRRNIISWKHV